MRRKTGDEPTDYKDFKIRRHAIESWLLFLKTYNSYYNHITVCQDNLLAITNLNQNHESVSAWNLLSRQVLNPASTAAQPQPDHYNTNEQNITQGGIEQGAIPIEL